MAPPVRSRPPARAAAASLVGLRMGELPPWWGTERGARRGTDSWGFLRGAEERTEDAPPLRSFQLGDSRNRNATFAERDVSHTLRAHGANSPQPRLEIECFGRGSGGLVAHAVADGDRAPGEHRRVGPATPFGVQRVPQPVVLEVH